MPGDASRTKHYAVTGIVGTFVSDTADVGSLERHVEGHVADCTS
jgi:hypothetical protein